MNDLSIESTVYTIDMADLDRIVRSSDPSLEKMVQDKVKVSLRRPESKVSYTVSRSEFARLAHLYGEQYVADPSVDLDQYFDIVNGRLFSRSIPTQLAVLYLFGSGSHYRPNISALSAAGEAIAGFCMEQFGYQPLVRPLGIMPDIVFWTKRAGSLYLALVEAKASTTTVPNGLIEKEVNQFLVDIKTRAQGFRFDYEGYLITSQFRDGGKILCSCFRVDLGHYTRSYRFSSGPQPDVHRIAFSYANPAARLEGLIRLQAETGNAKDQYLTSVLSEEATRSATLDLLRQDSPLPQKPNAGSLKAVVSEVASKVEAHISDVAKKMGLAEEWAAGQKLNREEKAKEKDHLTQALTRVLKPSVKLDE